MESSTLVHPVARLRNPDGGDFLLYPGRVVKMGRSSENDVVLNDPKISRYHAVLEWTGAGFAIRDLGSINGTRVNNEVILGSVGRALRDGDEIRFNQRVLIYEIVRADSSEPVTRRRAQLGTGPLKRRSPTLLVTAGPDAGTEYPLWGDRVVIGRASRAASVEIRLADDTIAPQHASLEQAEDGCYCLVNLTIFNQTLLNDDPFNEPVRLKDGDRIRIGQNTLVFHQNKS